MNASNRLNTCFVCGHPMLPSEGFPLKSPRVLRHRKCSKEGLVLELRKRAGALGLTSLDLLTRRLAELQDGVLQALGEVGFEQFQTAEPAGYLHLFLSEADLKVRVVFSRHVQSEAIYLETLMTPSELRQQKTRMLLQIREQTPARAGSMHTGYAWMKSSRWFTTRKGMQCCPKRYLKQMKTLRVFAPSKNRTLYPDRFGESKFVRTWGLRDGFGVGTQGDKGSSMSDFINLSA